MEDLFMSTMNELSNKQALETKYNNSRSNLLLVVVFTVVNLVLLITNSDTYFLFSAYIPYMLVTLGMMFCGMFPEDYYGEEFSGMEFLDTSVFAVFLGLALIIVALYLISWIFSKKNRVGWLIVSLVIFSVDTLAMFALMGFELESIIDIVFHAWIIISLSLGINSYCKLKKLPVQEADASQLQQTEERQEGFANSQTLRAADTNVKARTLIETEVFGHTVTYRRVKRVNELVVDGIVYDELEILIEGKHSLEANVDGHLIQAGFDGAIHSYLKVDGELIAKKVRLY